MATSDTKTPLLENTVNYKQPSSGRWRSAGYIISVEMAERFAYFGIGTNLIMYLTGPLGQSMADAAANCNALSGTATVFPLVGAFVADSYLGRYRTILVASLLYVLGLALATVSAYLPSLSGSDCQRNLNESCSTSLFQVVLLFFSLYLVAAAQGGHKPCLQAFGADQFDGDDPDEKKEKSSFFNWWHFGVNCSVLVTTFAVSYIQENFSWGLGFGIPCVAMIIGSVVFILGTKTYRSSESRNEKGPFTRIGRVFATAFENRNVIPSPEFDKLLPQQCSQHFKFLNKAMSAQNDAKEEGSLCSASEVEEAKAVLRLLPIWGSCLVYGVLFAQLGTFFTKQAATMDRIIFSDFKIPAASFHCIFVVAILVCLPIYDRVLIPLARSFTGKPSGITSLQRAGTGIFLSVIAMIIAALVEIKRLEIARESSLVDEPSVTIPISVWWMAPQNILMGIADVFTTVGMQEFFYDQVPAELRSIGIGLYLSVFGVGSFLSSFLVMIIERATGTDNSWFPNNMNKAHLDYFYWLLAGLSLLGFASYLHFARSYIYNRKGIYTI